MGMATGFIEVYGLAAAFTACDAGCKAANVTVENFDKNKPGNPASLPVPLIVCIKFRGSVDAVTAAIEDVDFPEKFYGIYHLPAGNYTSLQVRIGQAQGKNWWCVMYPNMCFRDNTYEVVGEDEKEQMYQVFTLYQYKKLIESEDKQIRFRYL